MATPSVPKQAPPGPPPQEPRAKAQKGVYIGAPACFALELACKHLNKAFGGTCYVVGSVLQRPDWRDVDVRLMIDDEAFKALFPDWTGHPGTWEFDARWLVLTVSISAWLSQQTGLPIDFQFQPVSHANARHAGPRNPTGLTYAKPAADEDH